MVSTAVPRRELHWRALAARAFDAPFLTLEAAEHLSFPPLSNRLDRPGRKVRRGSVLETRAQEGVDVGMRGAAVAAVLMDGEDSLDAACGATEGLLHGVPDHPLGQEGVEAGKTVRSVAIDRENEAEVDRLPEASCVLDESPANRPFVSTESAVTEADPVQLTTLPVG